MLRLIPTTGDYAGLRRSWKSDVVAGVTVAYTLFGGFLAVSYTDFVQGLMMFLALIAVPLLGLHEAQYGGRAS